MYNPITKALNNNAILIVIIIVFNVIIYFIDKNFAHTKTCYTVAAVSNIFFGVKLTINSYMNMNTHNTSKTLSK